MDDFDIDIRPESDIYGTYRRLSYTPWYAIAEFVDNSTQNYFDNEQALRSQDGFDRLEISITYDRHEGALTVVDNAIGMGRDDLSRAVRLNKPPTDTSGRSEFGLGLKTAACWLGPRWTVVSKKLGEHEELSVTIDVDRFREERPTSVSVDSRTVGRQDSHYTRVEVTGLNDHNRKFVGRTVGKIKENLASMYRRDLASGSVRITFNDEALGTSSYEFLTTQEAGKSVEWRKEVNFGVDGLHVSGWIAILAKGRQREAGFHLFRRGRMIRGGAGQGWKPVEIFGSGNSFQSQRLIGELDLDEWPVSHTKDAFDWEGHLEDELIKSLAKEADDYVRKAKEYRVTDDKATLDTVEAAHVMERAAVELSDEDLAAVMMIIDEGLADPPIEEELALEDLLSVGERLGEPTVIRPGARGLPTVRIWIEDDAHPLSPYLRVAMPKDDEMLLSVNGKHPFVEEFVAGDLEALHLYLHFLLADALLERAARRHPDLRPSELRDLRDKLLRQLRNQSK